MKQLKEATLLRIYLGQNDKDNHKPLYEQIVIKAKELHLSGATVLQGVMGFGAHSHMHSSKILRLAESLPVVIEIVDTQENIDKLMPFLDEHVSQAMVTIEKVQMVRYTPPNQQ